jgi:hypothetical protein
MRSKSKALLVVVVAVGMCALVWGLAGADARSTHYDYRVELEAPSLGLETCGGHPNHLSATLRLVGHGAHEGGSLVAASLVDVEGETELVGANAWVVVVDGRVERVYFDAQAPHAFQQVMRTTITIGQPMGGDGETWNAVAPSAACS